MNTPAATDPRLRDDHQQSLRFHFLIFAAAVPSVTPGTGSSASAVGGV